MARLLGGKLPQCERAELAEKFAAEHSGITLLFKGARTVIATEGEQTLFNTTGGPGIATGGMGDVLSGVCAALLAAGMRTHHAGASGSRPCGRAAEIALREGASEESLLASDLPPLLGRAFDDLKRGAF